MSSKLNEPTAIWYRKSAGHILLFGLMWLGECFLLLMFAKWLLHSSAVLYLLMIPWTLLGAVVFARPNWIMRMSEFMNQKVERDTDRLDKWTPPGFP
jgi:hypothetical protein